MPVKLKMTIQLNEKRLAKIAGTTRVLAQQVLPRAAAKVAGPVKEAFKKHLPDSDVTSSRDKQSRKAKERWKYKFNQQLQKKVKQDDRGLLLIVGVRIPQGQYAYIDLHRKAVHGEGREHILWGKKRKGLRKAPKDVPKIVRFEMAKFIADTVEAEIRAAVAAGEFM